jgi:hypothetical protein
MRRVAKTAVPPVLAQNAQVWLSEYAADHTNATKKYRYRHPEIKAALVAETNSKCVYCESKIGHNTPGDVEHKIPSSVEVARHFDWGTLTIACTECNRRKNAYFSTIKPFLDPYHDDVEKRVVHHGPTVGWLPGDAPAEVTVRTLQLNEPTRRELLFRKVELIDKLNVVVGRMSEADPLIQGLMRLKVSQMKGADAEYSAMVRSVCDTYGI